MTSRELAAGTALLFLAAFALQIAHAADFITIGVGEVSVVHAKGSIGTVAVGNPLIADVALDGDNAVMVFGKKAGQTDLVLMSPGHRQILQTRIVVSATTDPDTIIVRRPGAQGLSEEAWYCSATCVRVTDK